MKNRIILITYLLFLFLTLSYAQPTEMVGHVYTYKDSIWYRTSYNYDSQYQIIGTTISTSTNKNSWNNQTYCTKTYTNGAISKVCDYIWKNNEWSLTKTQTYNYLANRLTSYTSISDKETEVAIFEYYDTINIETRQFLKNDSLKYTNTIIKKFNKNKELSYLEILNISSTNDTLFSFYSTFRYENNQIITTSYQKTDSLYTAISQTIQYINNNNQMEYEVQYVNQNELWINTAKQTYSYNDNGMITAINYQYWNNNFWDNSYKELFEYNKDNTLHSKGFYELKYKEWELLYEITYEYNNVGNITSANLNQTFWSERDQIYNDYIYINSSNPPLYVLGNKAEIIYNQVETDLPLNLLSISVYPNPTYTGIVLINTKLPILDVVVYDTNGRKLYQESHTNRLDLSHLNNGVYLIQITTKEGSHTFKQIITNN